MRTLIGTFLAGVLTLLACERGDTQRSKPATASAESEPSTKSGEDVTSEEGFLRHAHLGALEDLVPVVEAISVMGPIVFHCVCFLSQKHLFDLFLT